MSNEIYQWVKGKDNRKSAVLLAQKLPNGLVVIASSSQKNPDVFDRDLGLEIARNRIFKYVKTSVRTETLLSYRVRNLLNEFVERCQRYFKTSNIVIDGV